MSKFRTLFIDKIFHTFCLRSTVFYAVLDHINVLHRHFTLLCNLNREGVQEFGPISDLIPLLVFHSLYKTHTVHSTVPVLVLLHPVRICTVVPVILYIYWSTHDVYRGILYYLATYPISVPIHFLINAATTATSLLKLTQLACQKFQLTWNFCPSNPNPRRISALPTKIPPKILAPSVTKIKQLIGEYRAVEAILCNLCRVYSNTLDLLHCT